MRYVIFEDRGNQIKAAEGDVITLDINPALPDSAKTVSFDKVLLVAGSGKASIGAPYIDGASVEAEIIDRDFKGEKIDVIKYKRRKNYRRKQGHRQRHMTVKVTKLPA
ncbi:MAG: 50S ribosomal protein L21 [Phycisphaerales bacterium]